MSKTRNKIQLAIVMPAYNEEACIQKVCYQWLSILTQVAPDKTATRLIVVNDGSKDQTGALLDQVAKAEQQLIVIHQENLGHGPALHIGYRKAIELGVDWIFQVDSDDQFEAYDFFKLWMNRHTSNFLLGYRAVRHDAWYRLLITRLVRVANILLFGRFIPDANIPFRLIRQEWLASAIQSVPETTFAPNIFLSILGAASRQKLGHFEVEHKERQTGMVSILRWKLIKVCLRGLRELLLFRLRFPSGSQLQDLASIPLEQKAITKQRAFDQIA